MQKRPKAEVKSVTGPAKPPRLKAAKKQLQFESPLPRRTRAKQQQDDQLQKQQHHSQQEKREEKRQQKPTDKVIAMPGSSQDADTDAAAEAAVDVPETEPVPWPDPPPYSHPDPGQLTVSHSQSAPASASSSAAKRRLAEGCTSLMYACQRGDIVQVLAQMREKPQLLRQRDRSHRNALHYCAAQDVDRSKDLVAAASIAIAAPELLESADEDGFTPLHLAVIQGNLAMVNLLLANRADVNAVDNEGHSVVHWATVCGEVESLRAVLAAGASVAKPDANGGTPLHYAAQMCGASHDSKQQASSTASSRLSLEILGILLSHPQSSVDVQDKDGRQPLLWAASAGSAKAVIALVKAGARVESSDKDGLTALHCAGSRGHTECIDTLIGLCGAPTDLIDSNGCTALHYAVTLGHADATARLLDLEADPNRQDRKGRTPAHCGCSKGQFETLKLLKDRGANLWLRNAKGDLPLHEAAASGRRELLEWLLNQRPKQVNTTSNDGRSLLHIAAANDYTDMCKLLLDYGADVNGVYRNSRGLVLTPLDGALQRGHRSTAKFLQANGGQPANKVRLSSRRAGNPFHETNATDMVRPLKYVEKEELHDLRSSKKYVVYLKHADSDTGNGNGNNNGNGKVEDPEGDCSCSEQTYRKEQRLKHVCRRHKRRQLRRRTSSCGESKHERCSEICRSKSNIEIRRRKSRERYASSSEWEEEDEDDEDSCENCCYHKREKNRVVARKRSTSSRKSKNREDSEEEKSSPEKDSRKPLTVNGDHQAGNSKDQNNPKERQSSPTKEATFIKSPNQSARSEKPTEMDSLVVEESHAVELTDEEQEAAAKSVVTQVDVHHEPEENHNSKSSEELPEENGREKEDVKLQLSEEETQLVTKEVEQVIKIAATALSSESKSSSSEERPAESTEAPAEKPEEEVEESPKPVSPPKPATPPSPPKEEAAKPPSAAEKPQPNANTVEGVESAASGKKVEQLEEAEAKPKPNTPTPPTTAHPPPSAPTEPKKPPTAPQPRPSTPTTPNNTSSQPEPPQREQETRRSFTLLPSDSADDDPVPNPNQNSNPAASASDEPTANERKSSFQVLKSDDSLDEKTKRPGPPRKVEYETSNQVFQVVSEGGGSGVQLPSAAELEKMEYEYEEYDDEYDDDERDGLDPEHDSALRRFLSSGNRHGVGSSGAVGLGGGGAAGGSIADDTSEGMGGNGRKRRLKKRVRSGNKTRSNWKNSQDSRDGSHMVALATTSKDQDSGFEPSPRAERSKIPTLRSAHTAHMPRKPIYATLDGRSCSSRMENRKPGDKGACDMGAVTRSIQRNIRRYYMERKIFQHLLELKSLQIRSSKLNEAVLVKRAVDDYHKSCVLLGGETGTRLRRYNFSEYTFKNFELFLYETLKGLQRPGTNNFQNINEVYEEAERRLSPDYNAYEKALQCTTKTHRCLHAAHAYTGIPCAAYIPMMNHHTMPKFGFGQYKKTGSVSSFFLPKILTSGRAASGRAGGLGSGTGGGTGGSASGNRCNHKVALELSHGKNKQLISLPAEKLDSNKRYYVTFTVKDSSSQQQCK
ncbi:uncharacterized protein [Drosophila takahashii]|uniref:uncharacterized protein n=1 Tax=Drosophila takahashii TaxID=29030 RepID=UPI001CF83189|nr:uncharacterized protein LOC108065881 [Drosophila takahashii]